MFSTHSNLYQQLNDPMDFEPTVTTVPLAEPFAPGFVPTIFDLKPVENNGPPDDQDEFMEQEFSLTLPAEKVYSQDILVLVLNSYLKIIGEDISFDPRGACHGLALTWLKEMSKHKEKEFYATIKKIIDCGYSGDLDILRDDPLIDQFIKKVHRRQFPEKYTWKDNQEVRQENVDILLGKNKQMIEDGFYGTYGLKKIINKYQNGTGFSITENSVSKTKVAGHTIAIFIRDGKYYLYNANFENGEAKCSKSLTKEFKTSFYENFGYFIPQKMDLVIRVIDLAKPSINPSAFFSASNDNNGTLTTSCTPSQTQP